MVAIIKIEGTSVITGRAGEKHKFKAVLLDENIKPISYKQVYFIITEGDGQIVDADTFSNSKGEVACDIICGSISTKIEVSV
jgi:hypothetical protein